METFSLQQSINLRRAELGLRIHEWSFQRIIKNSVIFAGFILLFGITTFSVRGFFVKKAEPNLMPTTLAGDPTKTVMTGVNIANNGTVFISGALVSEISSGIIKTSVSWGDVNFVWEIQTNQATKFLDHQGKKQTFSDIKVGDIVNVTGKLVGEFVVNANFVRN